MFWKDFQKIGQIFDNLMEADKYGGEWESSINFVPSDQFFEIFKIDLAIQREELSLYQENEDLSVIFYQ